MKKILTILIVCLLSFVSFASVLADDGAELNVEIKNNVDGSATVYVSEDIASRKPTANINTALSEAYVMFENKVIASELKDSIISFKVEKEGTYYICEGDLEPEDEEDVPEIKPTIKYVVPNTGIAK